MRFAWSRGSRVFSQSRFYVCAWWPYVERGKFDRSFVNSGSRYARRRREQAPLSSIFVTRRNDDCPAFVYRVMFFFAFSPRLGIINVVIGFRLVSHTPTACLIVISDGLIKRMESRISACVHTCCFFLL